MQHDLSDLHHEMRRINDRLDHMEWLVKHQGERIMAALDDIDAAVDTAFAQAQLGINRSIALMTQAVTLIQGLQSTADPTHAAAIVAKIQNVSATFAASVKAAQDALDAVMNPAPAP